MASLTTSADKSRSIEIPSSQVARFCEASVPQSAPVLTCVSFLCRKPALCVRLELDRPSFANDPLIERCGLAFDRTDADPSLLVESDQDPCPRSERSDFQYTRSIDHAPQPRTARRRRVGRGTSGRFRVHRYRPADRSCHPIGAYRHQLQQFRSPSLARPSPETRPQ